MKFASVICLFGSVTAFNADLPFRRRASRVAPLFETVEATTDTGSVDVSASLAKTELLELVEELNGKYGVLIIDSKAQEQLRDAVEKLEMVTESPTDPAGLVGDWTLLCSTASATIEQGPLTTIGGIDTSKIPFFNEGPLKMIRDRINKNLKVEETFKVGDGGDIDQINHTIDYMPPATLSEFLANVPDAIKNFNINPLQVKETKTTLVNKAQIEEVDPMIKVKLTLSSVIVNVAGTSRILEAEGKDVLSLPIPFGEQIQFGSFDTPYMDDKIRISRSKVGIVDQLRVFVKSELQEKMDNDAPVIAEIVPDDEDLGDMEAPSDVEGTD